MRKSNLGKRFPDWAALGLLWALGCGCAADRSEGGLPPSGEGFATLYSVSFDRPKRDLVSLGEARVMLASFTDSEVFVMSLEGTRATQDHGARYAVGRVPRALAAGDFNGDGLLDAASADVSDRTISVLPGRNDATFSARREIALSAHPFHVAVGNIGGDQRPELLATVGLFDDPAPGVLVLAFDAAFNEAERQHLAVPGARYVTTGDLDADGDLDVAVLVPERDRVVLFRNQDGRLSEWVQLGTCAEPSAAFLGAVWSGARPQLVVSCRKEGLQIFSDLGPSAHSQMLRDSGRFEDLAVADVDGDGNLDLAAVEIRGGSLHLWLSAQGGASAAPLVVDAGRAPVAVKPVTVDGDPVAKLAVLAFEDRQLRILGLRPQQGGN